MVPAGLSAFIALLKRIRMRRSLFFGGKWQLFFPVMFLMMDANQLTSFISVHVENEIGFFLHEKNEWVPLHDQLFNPPPVVS